MSLATQMQADRSLLTNPLEHGRAITAKDEFENTYAINVVLEDYRIDVINTDRGTMTVRRARLGMNSDLGINGVNDKWKFIVDGDVDLDTNPDYWSVDRDVGGVAQDGEGFCWVPVIFAQIETLASREYRQTTV